MSLRAEGFERHSRVTDLAGPQADDVGAGAWPTAASGGASAARAAGGGGSRAESRPEGLDTCSTPVPWLMAGSFRQRNFTCGEVQLPVEGDAWRLLAWAWTGSAAYRAVVVVVWLAVRLNLTCLKELHRRRGLGHDQAGLE